MPILNEDEGYYQIGSAAKHTEYLVLSVTIAHASNLAQVSIMFLLVFSGHLA